MMSMLYKLRLIFAGILVALGAAVFAQIDGGISAPPPFEAGTFEATFEVGCTTTPSQTFNYTRVGPLVTLFAVDQIDCTGDSTSFFAGAGTVPAHLRPESAFDWAFALWPSFLHGGSTSDVGCIIVKDDGNLVYGVGLGCIENDWIASGQRVALFGLSITYMVSSP
jgi:hypothetical protein